MHAREEKLGLLFLQKLELKQTNYQTVLLKCSDFFSSSVADLALKARSLHEHKLKERCLYKDITCPNEQANQSKTTHKPQKTNTHDDPQIPQPDLRFASGNSEANSETPKTHQKTGPEPKQNTHKIDLPGDAVACPLHLSQKRANELGITAFGQA